MNDKAHNAFYTGETNAKGLKHGYGVMKSKVKGNPEESWTREGYWFNGHCGLEMYLQNESKDAIVQEFKIGTGGIC